MPYVDSKQKEEIDSIHIGSFNAKTPGQLNYAITKLMLNYCTNKACDYSTLNAVMGAVESAKLEFYRRRVAPYEDIKIEQNGDVYTGNLYKVK